MLPVHTTLRGLVKPCCTELSTGGLDAKSTGPCGVTSMHARNDGHPGCSGGIHAQDLGMWAAADHQSGMQHAVHLHVVHISCLTTHLQAAFEPAPERCKT